MGCLRVTFTIVLAQALYYKYYNLIVTATSTDKFTDPIDTKNYQEYLLSSSIEHSNHSRKFIVDILWIGISKLPKSVLRDNSGTFEICLSALREYAQATIKQHKLWALKMYDASSGIPPGFLTGNVQEIGSYDECVQIHTETLTGKFCAVKLNKTMTEHIALADIPVSYYLCVPSLCTAKNIQNIINLGARTISPNISFVADENSCFVKNYVPLNFYDWFAIIIFTAITGLCILGTALECVKFRKPGTIWNAVVAFSLRTNCQHLFGVVKNDDIVNSLYGLRFLLMVWIVLIHRYSQVHTVPTMGLFKWNTLIQDWSRVIITNGYICVDTFFVMGGMLLSYTFLNKMDKGINFQVGKFYLHRYIRLTPALAGMVLFYATISDRFCEGPLFNNYYNAIKKPCVSNWWSALFYVNNYYETDNMCGTQTWYTSIDMQLYLLSPILLYPLIKHPWTVRYLLSSLIVISIVISIFQPYYNHTSAGYFIVGKAEDHRIFLNNYIFTHTRAASWLIGFGMGIYLHRFKRNPRKLSTKSVVLGWTLTVCAFVGVIFSILPLQQESHQYDPVYDTLYKSIHRHIWAVASCWFIFACATGYGGFVNKFLSWKGLFQPLGRLTYCINLTHILVLKLQMGAQRTPVNFTDITQITLAFGDIMASVFLAIILYLLFEAPGCALGRMLLSSDKKNKKSNNAFEEELQI